MDGLFFTLMIHHQVEQSQWLKQRNSVGFGLGRPYAVHDIALNTKLFRIDFGNNRRFSVTKKIEGYATGFVNHKGDTDE